jgi:hypothetical protein
MHNNNDEVCRGRGTLPVTLIRTNQPIMLIWAFAVLFAHTGHAQKPTSPEPLSPPLGPFTCTELIGLLSTGEWFDGGFYNSLGEFKIRWQGRFSHCGYTDKYAKLDSYAWSATNVRRSE